MAVLPPPPSQDDLFVPKNIEASTRDNGKTEFKAGSFHPAPSWRIFFEQLSDAIGTVIDIEVLVSLLENQGDSSALRDATQALAEIALADPAPDQAAAIGQLATVMALLPTPVDQSAAIRDLAKAIALQDQPQSRNWSVLSGTHAVRLVTPAGGLNAHRLFFETDRTVYYLSNGTDWIYSAGQYNAAVASIPTLATTDAGFLFGVTDYDHLLKWSGSAWGWAPGDGGSGFLTLFEIDPGTGWHLYDGTPGVVYLKADGTTGTVTLPDLVSSGAVAAFLEGGGTNSGPTAAAAPTFTGIPATPAGTVSAPVFSGDAAPLTTNTFTPVGLATAALTSLNGSTTSYTPSGTNSTPTFTGASATPAGTVSATGEPRKLVRRPYFRQ